MAWNEPGGNNNDQDPWGGGKRGNDQGPPDLDEALRKGLDKLNRLLGGGRSGGGGSQNRGSGSGYGFLFAIVGIVIVAWLAFQSFYTVDERERAIVLRFGQYYQTEKPGLHFRIPWVDEVHRVQVTSVNSFNVRGEMLTEDENIVDVNLSVQYVVSDPKSYVLNIRDGGQALQYASDSALRHEVGSMAFQNVITEGRAELAVNVEKRLQGFLDDYHSGLRVLKVNVESTQPPQEVQDAFQDVQRAKEDEQRAQEEAETYRNKVVPEARGKAQRIVQDAQAYKQQVIDQATGDAARFDKVLSAYKQAPEVTRERLYLSAMEKIMGDSSKVMLNTHSNDNVIFLPLNRLSQGAQGSSDASDGSNSGSGSADLSNSDIQALTDRVVNELRSRQDNSGRRGR